MPQSQDTDKPMAPWGKDTEWPGNATITRLKQTHGTMRQRHRVTRKCHNHSTQTYGTMRKIHRMTRKCHNHSSQTNPWHHEVNTQNYLEMPQSLYITHAPWGKDTEWPGNPTITVYRQTHAPWGKDTEWLGIATITVYRQTIDRVPTLSLKWNSLTFHWLFPDQNSFFPDHFTAPARTPPPIPAVFYARIL